MDSSVSNKDRKIGLVLGGGVSHGIAHVGVLRVIERLKIKVDYMAATSSGGIVGALYAAGIDVDTIEKMALKLKWINLVKFKLSPRKLFSFRVAGVGDLVRKYIGDLDFPDLKIPLAIASTCLKDAKLFVLDKGNVGDAVAAGAAFPGTFSPVKIGEHLLADGGISGHQVPVDVAKNMGANFVIASDVVPIYRVVHMPTDPLHVLERSLNILIHNLGRSQTQRADLIIAPHIAEEDLWSLDEKKARRLIYAGEMAANQALSKFA